MKIVPLMISAASLALAGCTSTPITNDVSVIKSKGQMNIVDDQYRSKGSSDAILGSYGRRLSHGINRYQNDGWLISDFDTRKPRVVNVTFDNVDKLEKFGFKLSEEAKANLNINRNNKGSYRLVVVKPKDPSLFEKKARSLFTDDEFFSGKAKNADFRYIDSVVYIVSYEGTKTINWGATANANLDRVAEGFSLDIDLGQTRSTTVELPDNQIIAYQFRRLCWRDGKIVDAVKDLIGGDAKACKSSDTEYPGGEG